MNVIDAIRRRVNLCVVVLVNPSEILVFLGRRDKGHTSVLELYAAIVFC